LGGGAANSHGGDCDQPKPGRQYSPASEVQGTQHFIVSSGVPYGSTARGPTLEHDPKTENQFSEKLQSTLKSASLTLLIGKNALPTEGKHRR
jgi:hypothetical protein